MTLTEHVRIGEWNGQCLLTVWDAELHDFLDDLFDENDLEHMSVFPPASPKRFQLLFSEGISASAVHSVVSHVGAEEIERIVRVNSSVTRSHAGV